MKFLLFLKNILDATLALRVLIFSLFVGIITGCSSYSTCYIPKQKKQIFQKNLEKNYLLCKSCLTYTKINFNQSLKEEPCCIAK